MDFVLCRVVFALFFSYRSSNASRDAVEDNVLTMRQSERVGLVCQSAIGSITLCPSDFGEFFRINGLVKTQLKAELLLMVAQQTSDGFGNGEVGAVGSVVVGNFDFRIVALRNIVLEL